MSLQTYLRTNRERLHYRERLLSGLSLGSGVVEGSCKNFGGSQIETDRGVLTAGAGGEETVLCAALYSKQWKHVWKRP